MNSSNFNLHFSAGDECYAVLTGLDRSRMEAQAASEQLGEFVIRFDQLRRKFVNGSVPFDKWSGTVQNAGQQESGRTTHQPLDH